MSPGSLRSHAKAFQDFTSSLLQAPVYIGAPQSNILRWATEFWCSEGSSVVKAVTGPSLLRQPFL